MPAGGAEREMGRPRRRARWRSWFLWVTLGEFAGFVVPATAGALTVQRAAPVMAAALLTAGVVEGTALGAAQAHVLGRAVPALPRRRFVLATALAAVVAYAIGLVPALAGERLSDVSPWVLAVSGLLLGGALLATIGTAQWLVLRGHVPRAWRWIPATAVAWGAGLVAFTAVASPLWHEGQPLPVVIAIGALGGLVMAAVVAAITGSAFVRLVDDRPAAEPTGA